MTRNTPAPSPGIIGRRIARFTVAGAVLAAPAAVAPAAHATDWDAVAQCESSGNWSTNTGNGFSGGLQFTPSTWHAFGGSGSPQQASRSEQIQVAEKVKAGQGMGAWPVCGKHGGGGSSSSSGSSGSGSSGSGSSGSSSSGSSSSGSGSSSKHAAAESSSFSSGSHHTDGGSTHHHGHGTSTGSYTVQGGDTLNSIAAEHHVTGGGAALAEHNGIADPDHIYPGQHLTLS